MERQNDKKVIVLYIDTCLALLVLFSARINDLRKSNLRGIYRSTYEVEMEKITPREREAELVSEGERERERERERKRDTE